MIRVRNDFEGARLGSALVDGAEVNIELLYETPVTADWMTHEYRLHFTFGIENLGDEPRNVRVKVGGASRETLPPVTPLIYMSSDPLTGYRPYNVSGATDEYQLYDFDMNIAPKQVTYIANCLPRPLSRLTQQFDSIAEQAGAERIVFGKTLEGRELVAYRYGIGDKPVVLVSSGIHPPEPDTLATEALMGFMADTKSAELRRHFDFVFAPILNPDGYHHGSQAGNAAGINFYWDFRHWDNNRCPEAAYFYEFALKTVPLIYFDFHAYTFQWKKHASPYIKPLSRYRDGQVRQLVARINETMLRSVSDGKSMTGFPTYAPSTLGEKLTRKFNTITYAKYHVHLKDGEQGCRDHALKAVSTACSVAMAADMASNQRVLVAPHGEVKRELLHELVRWLAVYWHGWLLSSLREVYGRMLPTLRKYGLR